MTATRRRPYTDFSQEELARANELIGRVSGYNATIINYEKMLTGRRPIGRTSLAMAAFEGRDLIAETREKWRIAVLRRLEAAIEAEAMGIRMRRMAIYRAAAAKVNEPPCSAGATPA